MLVGMDGSGPDRVLILAGGAGKRMNSRIPKPLHLIGGLPMIGHTLRTAEYLVEDQICVVTSPKHPQVAEYVRTNWPKVKIVEQTAPTGSGGAVLAARDFFGEGIVAIMYADSPLTTSDTLQLLALMRRSYGINAAFMGFQPQTIQGYGRMRFSKNGYIDEIVEGGNKEQERNLEKDEGIDEEHIAMANGGAMCVEGPDFIKALKQVPCDVKSGEVFLTAVAEILAKDKSNCRALEVEEDEALGVNSRADLAKAEAAFQRRARKRAMEGGATLIDPDTTYFSYDTKLDQDVTIASSVVMGPGVHIETGAHVLSFSSLEGCHIEQEATVGPHARIRPDTRIGPRCRIGNFVEVKNSDIGADVRAGHLAYIGDASVGDGVNIGAGAVVCNYDGTTKHRTEISEGAFIGSNSSLVAPIQIGKNAYVGSGSVLTKDVEEEALAVSRIPQTMHPGVARKLRNRDPA